MASARTLRDDIAQARASWKEWEALFAGLSDEELLHLGDDGWNAKDHVAHVTSWERSLLALLERRPRLAEMGLDPTYGEPWNTDRINEGLLRLSRAKRPAQVLAEARQVHAALEAAMERLTEEEAGSPYRDFATDDNPHRDSPIRNWLAGDTWEHYDEHAKVVRAMRDPASQEPTGLRRH